MVKTSFFRRLLLSFLLLILVCIGIFSLYAYFPLRRSFLTNVETNLSTSAITLGNHLSRNDFFNNQKILQNQSKNFASDLGMRITIVDKAGKVLVDSEKNPLQMGNHRNRPEIKDAFLGKIGTSIRYSSTLGINMMYVAVPLKKNKKIIGALRTSVPLLEIKGRMKSINKTIGIATFLSFFLALIMSAFFARMLAKPLSTMTNFTNEVTKGDIKKRLSIRSKDEFSIVAESFNLMLDRLESQLRDLKTEKERISIFLESAKEAIIGLDRDGKILLFNAQAEKLFDFTSTSASGHYFWEIARSKEVSAPVFNFFRHQHLTETLLPFHTPEGKIFEFRMNPVDSKTASSGLLLIGYDLTEERKIQEMRKTFITNASHELRSPLATLRVALETLQEEAGEDERTKSFLSLAERQILRLQNLADDLLSLSIVESELPKSIAGGVDIYKIVEELHSEFEIRAKKKEQNLIFHLSDNLPLVKGEERWIEQVFSNLLDNALKFTHPGGKIILTATRDKKKEVRIEISDNGPGIPEEDLEKIFERFYRVDKARSRSLGGTGLGLSIVKHIVQSYGGRIRVESKLKEGSSFFLTLPTV